MISPGLMNVFVLILFCTFFCMGYKKGIVKILSGTLSWLAGILLCKPLAVILYPIIGKNLHKMIASQFSLPYFESMAESLYLTNIFILLISFALTAFSTNIFIEVLKSGEKIQIIGVVSNLLGGFCECFKLVIGIWGIYSIATLIAIPNNYNGSIFHLVRNVVDKSSILAQLNSYNIFLTILNISGYKLYTSAVKNKNFSQ